MRRFEGHQQGETKRDNPVFTESAAVKVSCILLGLSTPSQEPGSERRSCTGWSRAEQPFLPPVFIL